MMSVAIRYPNPRVIETVSPPVSPSVVAATLTIQNSSVTAGTFAAWGPRLMSRIASLQGLATVAPGAARGPALRM